MRNFDDTRTEERKKRRKEMAVEIPKDLVTKLQISLRSQANVPSYDPNDPSLPNFHSLPHSVSDSSLPGICLHCKNHLLRGPDSLLCIFCGKHQATLGAAPQPINFKSTSGYRWFLRSLNLDGSEIVGDSLDGDQAYRGSREEFPLSDLLDLEISWNDSKQEMFESFFSKNNSLNLAGLDDFLAERTGDSASKGKVPVNIDIDSTTSTGENLNLFENFQGSENSGSVSSWQADFQSGNPKTDNSAYTSQTFDLNDGIQKENQYSSQSRTNNWFQDDRLSNSTSGVRIENANISSSANQGDQGQSIEINVSSKETDDSFDTWNDFKGSTSSQDAAQRYLEKTAAGMKSMNETSAGSVLEWGSGSESSVFKSQHEVSKSFDQFAGSSADLSTHMDSVFGTGIDSLQGKAVDNTNTSHANNWFQDDLWSNSTSEPVHHDEQSAVNLGDKDGGMLGNLNNTSISVSMSQDDLWPTSKNSVAANGTNDEDDDTFGAWNDFKGSGAPNASISSTFEPANQTSSKEERISEPLTGWDAYFQSSNSEIQLSDPFVGSSINLSDHMYSVFSSGKGSADGKAKDSNNVSNASNWFHDDLWSNSTSRASHQTKNSDATVDVMDSGTAQSVHSAPSLDTYLFPDDKRLISNKQPDGKIADQWNDFKSSTTAQDALSSSWKQAAISDKEAITDRDGLSAAWNDFTSSTSAKHASSSSSKEAINHEEPSIETSEIQFLGTDSSSHNNSFGCLSQSDFFSGPFSNQNDSTEARFPGRLAEATEGEKSGELSSATTGSKADDLEILMSQMHDLSFMLESSLSLPTKVDKCK